MNVKRIIRDRVHRATLFSPVITLLLCPRQRKKEKEADAHPTSFFLSSNNPPCSSRFFEIERGLDANASRDKIEICFPRFHVEIILRREEKFSFRGNDAVSI